MPARTLPEINNFVRSRVRRELWRRNKNLFCRLPRVNPRRPLSQQLPKIIFPLPKIFFENFDKHRAITCFNCDKFGHVSLACKADASSVRKCYGCGGVGHIARDCPTRAAQSAANANLFTSGAVSSHGKGSN